MKAFGTSERWVKRVELQAQFQYAPSSLSPRTARTALSGMRECFAPQQPHTLTLGLPPRLPLARDAFAFRSERFEPRAAMTLLIVLGFIICVPLFRTTSARHYRITEYARLAMHYRPAAHSRLGIHTRPARHLSFAIDTHLAEHARPVQHSRLAEH
jgi:hypothetical protein